MAILLGVLIIVVILWLIGEGALEPLGIIGEIIYYPFTVDYLMLSVLISAGIVVALLALLAGLSERNQRDFRGKDTKNG